MPDIDWSGAGAFRNMFAGCTSLTEAVCPDTDLKGTYCCQSMYQGCSSLSSIQAKFKGWGNTQLYMMTWTWVDGVAANGTFTCPSQLGTNETIQRGANYCPNNWTVVNV